MRVQRPLPSLRLPLASALTALLTAAFALLSVQNARAADRASAIDHADRMPEVKKVHTLPVASLGQSASTAEVASGRSVAMPVMRDIRGLQSLRQSLRSEKLTIRQVAVHRAASLSVREDNVSYLENLRPILQALAYDEEADDGTRLLALSTLYRITSDRPFRLVLQEKLKTESSAVVRQAMQRMIAGAFEPSVSIPA
jgi:hypothetical protein